MATNTRRSLIAAMLIAVPGVAVLMGLADGAGVRPTAAQDTLTTTLRASVDSGTCVHRPTTKWNCPTMTRLIPIDSVRSIAFTIYKMNGQVFRRTFRPESLDAVFFTPDAVEKFVFPYYARVFGADTAAQMRQLYYARPGMPARPGTP